MNVDIIEIDESQFYEEEIVSISKEQCMTLDLEVEDVHHYILSNGIISHNSSVFCDVVSNGLEPVFSLEYERKIMCNWPKGLTGDNVKTLLKHIKEHDYEYWRGDFGGRVYYFEPHNRGLCEVNTVRDYGYQWLLDNFPDKDHSSYLLTTQELSIQSHLEMQQVVQYYCNQSVSKTCNLPNDYPFEDFKQLYINAWKYNLNGFTTYRDGCMESVISSIEHAQQSKQLIQKDIKLPDVFINGPTNIIKREGLKFYLHFSYLPEDVNMTFPFCLWIYSNTKEENQTKICNKASRKIAQFALKKGITKEIVQDCVTKARQDYSYNRLGRMISLCLRHNIQRVEILSALRGIEGDNISTLLTAVRKFISLTIEDGTKVKGLLCENDDCSGDKTNVIFESGCTKCLDCGWSGCN